jgi:hypothetical protein
MSDSRPQATSKVEIETRKKYINIYNVNIIEEESELSENIFFSQLCWRGICAIVRSHVARSPFS